MAVVATFAALRWTGQEPVGSDHDEYRMVAESLLAGEGPVVAGVEGTKYPLGYPLLLAGASAVGLPMTRFALALNVALAGVLVILVWAASRSEGPLAALAAGGFVAVGVGLWSSVYAVMPDVALTAVVAAVVLAVVRVERRAPREGSDRGTRSTTTRDEVTGSTDVDARRAAGPARGVQGTWRPRDVAVLAVLSAVAVALKSVAVLLGLAIGAHLLLRPTVRGWAWLPPAAGIVTLAAQFLAVRPHPEHTTGYAATFWLVDPFDAAAGTIGPLDLPARVVQRIDLFVTDAARAVIGPQAPDPIAIVALIALLALAIAGWRRERPLLAVFVVTYAVGLAAWPYRSIRFGMPLHPLAALGVAAAVGAIVGVVTRTGRAEPVRGAQRSRWLTANLGIGLGHAVTAATVVVSLAAFGAWSAQRVLADAADEEVELAEVNASVAASLDWISANIPEGEPIASLDYREFTWRLERTLIPVRYTSDPEELWAQTGGSGAEWFVAIRGLYNAREARTRELLSAYPDRFEEAYANERVEVWRIRTPE